MKASELRIGNLVKINGIELALTSDLFCLVVDGQTAPPEPIPLTEELLLKFGFSKSNDYLYLEFKNGNISFNDELKNGVSLCVGEYCTRGSEFDNIIYVHQLQNLYFALTNDELIINK